MPQFRLIPSIESILQRGDLQTLTKTHGHTAVAAAVRRAAEELRATLATGASPVSTSDDAEAWLAARARQLAVAASAPSLQRVINATGVILHTNLGRAPLSAAATAAAAAIAAGYSNLEYDLEDGRRGARDAHVERLLCQLTTAEAAAVVNNNAAAVWLALATLADGREVIVSRGELVEIGGGFRVPDIMTHASAVLREVGTTNRTRLEDYAAAISDRTAIVLRVHQSNFRIEGFTERPGAGALASLAHRFGVPLVEDLGSGLLAHDIAPPALAGEPSMRASLEAGVDLVAASGDKLLGGPQAGLLAGSRTLIDRVRRHPLARALRVDKQAYAALSATLALWANERRRVEIPVYRMLTLSLEDLDRRARSIADRLTAAGLACDIADGASTLGGGTAPGSLLPTRLVMLSVTDQAPALERRLRFGTPPIVARIIDDRVAIDPRTIAPDDDDSVIAAVVTAAAPATRQGS
jgi:L-seryl-tRNA(Ser) seleniumtransferase